MRVRDELPHGRAAPPAGAGGGAQVQVGYNLQLKTIALSVQTSGRATILLDSHTV